MQEISKDKADIENLDALKQTAKCLFQDPGCLLLDVRSIIVTLTEIAFDLGMTDLYNRLKDVTLELRKIATEARGEQVDVPYQEEYYD